MQILLMILRGLWSRPGMLALGLALGFWKGWAWHSNKQEVAEYRAQITELQRQIKNTQDVLEASQEREKAALEEMQNLGQQITDYASELEKEKVATNVPQDQKSVVQGPSPYLSRHDVKRLCSIYPAACPR